MAHETVNKICQILTCSYQVLDKQSAVVHVDCKEVNVHLDYIHCKMDLNKNDIHTSYVDAWFNHHPISKATEHMYSETWHHRSTSKDSHDTCIFDKPLTYELE